MLIPQKKPGVSIFPTIKLFPSGNDNKVEQPAGITFKGKETNLKNIAAFVAKHATRTPQEQILKRTGPTGDQWAQHVKDDDITLGQTLIINKEDL